MKKLILGVAMLCATSMLFAQTQFYTSNPYYYGNGSQNPTQWASGVTPQAAPAEAPCDDCTIPQIQRMTYMSYDNENNSIVNQTGANNDANVYQLGIKNYSII